MIIYSMIAFLVLYPDTKCHDAARYCTTYTVAPRHSLEAYAVGLGELILMKDLLGWLGVGRGARIGSEFAKFVRRDPAGRINGRLTTFVRQVVESRLMGSTTHSITALVILI